MRLLKLFKIIGKLTIRVFPDAWWALFFIPALLLLPDARFEEAQNPGVTEEREGLLTSEPTSQAAPVVATEWSVRREVVDAWKRLGNVLR